MVELQEDPSLRFDVQFTLHRFQLYIIHEAADLLETSLESKILKLGQQVLIITPNGMFHALYFYHKAYEDGAFEQITSWQILR
jgi:hypothetical protein